VLIITIYLIPSAIRISVRRLLLFRSETERECKLIRHPRPSAFPRSIEFLSAVTTVGLGLLAGTNSNHRCVCSPAADTIVRAAHLSAPPAQVGYWRTGRVTPRAINFDLSKMTTWEPERWRMFRTLTLRCFVPICHQTTAIQRNVY